MKTIKLAKALAQAGIASRRKSEELIEAGRVSVNGSVQKVVATRVDPSQDTISFDGTPLPVLAQPDKKIVLALHKPAGFVSTASDPDGKPTVMEFIPKQFQEFRLFPVGRLDEESEGLILLTNDGDLAYELTHPKFEVPKTYFVWIEGRLTKTELTRLKNGIWLREKGVGKKTQPAEVQILMDTVSNLDDDLMESEEGTDSFLQEIPEQYYTDTSADIAYDQLVKITITEGLHRQVRRMFKAVNHEVLRLKRVSFGTFQLEDLPSGEVRVEREF